LAKHRSQGIITIKSRWKEYRWAGGRGKKERDAVREAEEAEEYGIAGVEMGVEAGPCTLPSNLLVSSPPLKLLLLLCTLPNPPVVFLPLFSPHVLDEDSYKTIDKSSTGSRPKDLFDIFLEDLTREFESAKVRAGR
jgi:hypothetical protein